MMNCNSHKQMVKRRIYSFQMDGESRAEAILRAFQQYTLVVSSTTYQIPKAYVLCNDNVKKVGKITYLPIYMLMFIKKGESVFYGLSFDCSLISGGRDYRKLFQLYVSKYPLAPYNGTLVISSCSR